MRLTWANKHDTAQGTTTIDLEPWTIWSVYDIDLADLAVDQVRTPFELWNDGEKRRFAIDPHHASTPRTFHIDYVTLSSDDEAVGDQFTVHWAIDDPDARLAGGSVGGAPSTVSIFYDVDTDPSSGLTLIASGLSGDSYVWDTSALPQGRYFIRAVADDGLNSQARYSEGPVKTYQEFSLTMELLGIGQGSVTSAQGGIDCGDDCSHTYDAGDVVGLTAVPKSSEYRFLGFSGHPDCEDGTVTMDGDKACMATFAYIQHRLSITLEGSGGGTVTSLPAGIDCRSSPRVPALLNGVVLVDPESRASSRLTSVATDRDPSISADGEWVAFWRDDALVAVRSSRLRSGCLGRRLAAGCERQLLEPRRLAVGGGGLRGERHNAPRRLA